MPDAIVLAHRHIDDDPSIGSRNRRAPSSSAANLSAARTISRHSAHHSLAVSATHFSASA